MYARAYKSDAINYQSIRFPFPSHRTEILFPSYQIFRHAFPLKILLEIVYAFTLEEREGGNRSFVSFDEMHFVSAIGSGSQAHGRRDWLQKPEKHERSALRKKKPNLNLSISFRWLVRQMARDRLN